MTYFIGKNYKDQEVVLVHDNTLKPVEVGETLTSFRGHEYTITGAKAPDSPASTGRIYADQTTKLVSVEFFPNVFDCRWVTSEQLEEHQQGRASHDPD